MVSIAVAQYLLVGYRYNQDGRDVNVLHLEDYYALVQKVAELVPRPPSVPAALPLFFVFLLEVVWVALVVAVAESLVGSKAAQAVAQHCDFPRALERAFV